MKMKNHVSKARLIIAPTAVGLFACQNNPKTPSSPEKPQEIPVVKNRMSGNYLGSDYKGNYVWGGAMNLAWTELNDNIIKEKIQLNTEDKIALDMASKLNNAPFSKKDLDDKSYYVKSGYGQGTVDEINRESKKKFPTKSFKDLEMKLDPRDIISYAYFLKEVEYAAKFDKDVVTFKGQKVKGFMASSPAQKANVRIINYESDDKFIIKLQLKDASDELILAKGYKMENPQDLVNELSKNNTGHAAYMDEADRFKAPKLHLDHHRNYTEMIGKYLANKGFDRYFIDQMFENIKFDMDEKGARVENEAVIVMTESAREMPDKPRNFFLDKPYWIIMKRTDSPNPYFLLGVNNVELMEVE